MSGVADGRSIALNAYAFAAEPEPEPEPEPEIDLRELNALEVEAIRQENELLKLQLEEVERRRERDSYFGSRPDEANRARKVAEERMEELEQETIELQLRLRQQPKAPETTETGTQATAATADAHAQTHSKTTGAATQTDAEAARPALPTQSAPMQASSSTQTDAEPERAHEAPVVESYTPNMNLSMLMDEINELRSIIECEPSGAPAGQRLPAAGARSESDAWQHVLSLGVAPAIASLKQRALVFRTELNLLRTAAAASVQSAEPLTVEPEPVLPPGPQSKTTITLSMGGPPPVQTRVGGFGPKPTGPNGRMPRPSAQPRKPPSKRLPSLASNKSAGGSLFPNRPGYT